MRHAIRLFILATSAFAGATTLGLAQESPNLQAALPGGASSLQETFDDWSVVCGVQNGQKACILSQQQIDSRTRQRIVAIELRAPVAGKVEGMLILPFGLSFEQGVALQIDDAAAGAASRFRTCLVSGCLAPVSFDAKAVTNLRKGTALRIKVAADGGQEVPLAISLKGFGGALDRVAALIR